MPTVGAQASLHGLRQLTRSNLVRDSTEQLRELILTNQLRPGTVLPQELVAARLGVSRTPLREAFRILEREGLVRTSETTGTVEVVQLTSAEMYELLEFREVVDGLAARLLAARGLEAELDARLAAHVEEMAMAAETVDVSRFMKAGSTFIRTLAESSGNHWVAQYVPLLRMSSQTSALHLQRLTESESNRDWLAWLMAIEHEAHREMLEAIRSGDPERAEERARRHMREARERVWAR
jgi:GntR family transcriptional regulator, vanillate catabolism transcriptional regulator